MKIVLVSPYGMDSFGGVQSQVTQFAQYARDVGHSVIVVAPTSKKVNYDGVVGIGRAVPLPIGTGTVSRLTFSFWKRGVLRDLLADENPDVVHVHEPAAPILGPLAVKYTNKDLSALVTTSHSNTSPNLVTWVYSTALRAFHVDRWMEKVDVRIAVSPAARKKANHYLPGEYEIIPNGIDVHRFSPKNTPLDKYMDGKFNVLFVGRLGNNEKRKGLYYALSAFNEFHIKHPNSRFIVVGKGKPDTASQNLMNSADSLDIIRVGEVPAHELPRYYRTAHVFIAPFTDGESFSLVAGEALASETPVVTSNIEGPRDVMLGFRDYNEDIANSRFHIAEGGILVQPRDTANLASALERLVSDESERQRMGRRGRQLVVNTFSWELVAPKLLALYDGLVETKNRDGCRVTALKVDSPPNWSGVAGSH